MPTGEGAFDGKSACQSAAKKCFPAGREMSQLNKTARRGPLHEALHGAAVGFAYAGGVVVSAIGLMSAAHIIGLWLFSSPIRGDFELVEFGIAIAGTLFLPYCQVTRSHIIVDFFTQRASKRTLGWLDSFGSLVMALTLLLIGWRTAFAVGSVYSSGETTALRELPLWIAYLAMAPGILLAGFIALAQAMGMIQTEPPAAGSDAL
jgi:TRAP-type C4-dicarboxylate transport system permease small subunit